MTRRVVKILLFLAPITGAFFVGRLIQDGKNGYEFEELARKHYDFPLGNLDQVDALETIGSRFMARSSNFLKFEDRTLFKCTTPFQESYPALADLKVEGDELTWTDGKFDYRLEIKKRETKSVSAKN